MSVVGKKNVIKCALNMIKLKNETMYIIFDDIVYIQFINNNFLIDDRNYFEDDTLRICNVDDLMVVSPKEIFVFVETIEEVIIYLNNNFKNYTFDELNLVQLTTGTIKEMNLTYPGSFETLCSSKPFDNDAYDILCKKQYHPLVNDNMIVL